MGTVISTAIDEDSVAGFVVRYGDAWRSRDADRILALCTPDTEWRVPGSAPLRGREAVRAWLRDLFTMVPDARIDYPVGPPYLSLDRTQASARFRIRGTMQGPMLPPGFAPTDGPIDDAGVEFYEEFREGLLARCTILFDRLNVAEQIGAAPAPGSAAERLAVSVQRLQARRMRRDARRG